MKENNLILLLALLSLALMAARLNFNGIFIDEEYYISVGRFFLAGNWQSIIGNPLEVMFGYYIVPVLFYLGSSIGGILMARFVSSLFIAGSIFAICLISRELFNNKAITIISAVLSISFAPIFFIGRFAVLDSAAFFFLSLSLFFIIKSSANQGKQSILFILLASVIAFIAFISKYITAIAFPALLLITFFKNRKYFPIFAIPLGLSVMTYIILFISDLQVLYSTQLASKIGGSSDTYLIMLGLLLPYLLIGVFSLNDKEKNFFIFLLCSLSVLVLHLPINNTINIFKHTVLAFVFIVPFASAGLFKILTYLAQKRQLNFTTISRLSFLLIFILLSTSSLLYSTLFIENFYANEERASSVMDSIVKSGDFVLTEDSSFRFYTKKIDFQRVITNFYFDYDGNRIITEEDYVNAIKNGYFSAILTTSQYHSGFDIEKAINSLPQSPYELFYEEEQNISSGVVKIRIYRRIENTYAQLK